MDNKWMKNIIIKKNYEKMERIINEKLLLN